MGATRGTFYSHKIAGEKDALQGLCIIYHNHTPLRNLAFILLCLLSLFTRKRVFGVCDQVRLKLACSPSAAGRSSSIGSVFAWHSSGPEVDPHVRHILSWRLGHENISTTILPLRLIQEEPLSVSAERMCTKYW